jgi:hypothetical protein
MSNNEVTAISDYLPRILAQIDMLQETVARYGTDPVPVNDVMLWFAFDSMGEFAFNQSFDMMKTGKWHKIIKQQRSGLSIMGSMNPVVWAMRLGFALAFFVPPVSDFISMIAFCEECINNRMKVRMISSHFCTSWLTTVDFDPRQPPASQTSPAGSSRTSRLVILLALRRTKRICWLATQHL